MEFRPSKFFMSVSIIDFVFYTISMIIMTSSSTTTYSKDPFKFLLILLHLLFFLIVSFSIFWYWKKKRFNTIWHKLYAVLRLIHSIILFVWFGTIEVFIIKNFFSNDITIDTKAIVGEFFFYLFLIVVSIYNIYLTYYYIKLTFMKSMKAKRTIQNLL